MEKNLTSIIQDNIDSYWKSKEGIKLKHDLTLLHFDTNGTLFYNNIGLFLKLKKWMKYKKLIDDFKILFNNSNIPNISNLLNESNLDNGLVYLMKNISDVNWSSMQINYDRLKKLLMKIKKNLLDYWFIFLPNKKIPLKNFDDDISFDNLFYYLLTLQNSGTQMITNKNFLKEYIYFTLICSMKILKDNKPFVLYLKKFIGLIDKVIEIFKYSISFYVFGYLFLLINKKYI